MNATEVISEIEQLPPAEQAEVIRYAYRLDANRKLSGSELGELARRMIEASDPAEALRWRDAVLRGFYGGTVDA